MATVIAHRGGDEGYPENTLGAFHRALELGADIVELDCKLTRDGVVVVLHDHNLKRIWGIPRGVGELDWEDLATLSKDGHHVPRLAEVLAAVSLPLMVDVPGPAVAAASAAEAHRSRAMGRCIFAGHTSGLLHVRGQFPQARLALSWERTDPPPAELLSALAPEYFNPHWRLARPDVVTRMHEAGREVSVWTVNQRWLMKRVLAAGVDAVITDKVSRLKAHLARAQADLKQDG